MKNTNTKAKSLNPIHNLEGKSNYQRFILVEKDGTRTERIILFVNNIELREEIICVQFLSRYVHFFIEQTTGIKFIARDKPWDFEIELSNSEKMILEITSIADETDLFRNFKYQERISRISNLEQIELHELIKLNEIFPDIEIKKQIEELKTLNTHKNQVINNPHFRKKFIFLSSINEDLSSFDDILRAAINKKINKNHPNKENVILIIDNRTVTYDLNNIIKYLDNLYDYFKNLPFKEVWLYTGYYSDLDGNNSEYSLIPLKLEHQKIRKLETKLK